VVLMSPRAERRPDDGAVAILITVVVVAVIMPLMAVVVDLGLARLLAQQSRGGADAAALAAAAVQPHPQSLADPQATAAVGQIKALVAANLPAPAGGWDQAWATCVGPDPLPSIAGPGSCISFDFTSKQVRVTAPQRNVPTIFSGALGRRAPTVSATTTASWGSDAAASTPCALCVLGNYGGGRKAVTVSGGDVAVGGSLSVSNGGGSLTASGGQVTYAGSLIATGTVSPTPVVGPAPTDPFASSLVTLRTMPNGQSVYGQASGLPFGPCQPGVYQDVSLCTSFGKGRYFVTGRPDRTVTVSLNADASDVVLLFTCSASGAVGVVAHACPSGLPPRFVGTGIGSHTVTAAGGGAGLALVFDTGLVRNERLTGNGKLTINGSVYGPGVTLRDGGSTSRAVVNGGRVVIGAVSFTTANPGATMLEIAAPPTTPQSVPDGPVRLVSTG
jgi:hypothetical protein